MSESKGSNNITFVSLQFFLTCEWLGSLYLLPRILSVQKKPLIFNRPSFCPFLNGLINVKYKKVENVRKKLISSNDVRIVLLVLAQRNFPQISLNYWSTHFYCLFFRWFRLWRRSLYTNSLMYLRKKQSQVLRKESKKAMKLVYSCPSVG